jgi:hypothetical protein
MSPRALPLAILPLAFLGLSTLGSHGCTAPVPGAAEPDLETSFYASLKKRGTLNDPALPVALFVQDVQGRQLVRPILKRRAADGHIDLVVRAESGELRVDAGRKTLRVRLRQCDAAGPGGDRARYKDRTWEFSLPAGFPGR